MFVCTSGQAAISGPQKFHQLVNFAAESGRNAWPFSAVEEAADALPGWSSGPGGIRASLKLDAAMTCAYRSRQIDRARAAMRDQFEADDDRDLSDFYNRERLATILIETGARATHASDGPASTLIAAEDLVELASEFAPILDIEDDLRREALRDDLLFEAENALRDYH